MSTTNAFVPYSNNTYWSDWYNRQVSKSELTWDSTDVTSYHGYGTLMEPGRLTVVTKTGETHYVSYNVDLAEYAKDRWAHPLTYDNLYLDAKNPPFVWVDEREYRDGSIDFYYIEDQDMDADKVMPRHMLPVHIEQQMEDLWTEWRARAEMCSIGKNLKRLIACTSPAIKPMEPEPPLQSDTLEVKLSYAEAFKHYTKLLSDYECNKRNAAEIKRLRQQYDKSITDEDIMKCSTFFGYFLSKCKSDETRLRHLMCYISIRQIDSGK